MTKKWSLIALGLQMVLLASILAMALAEPEWGPTWPEQAFMASAITFLALTPFGLMSVFFTVGFRLFVELGINREEWMQRLAQGYPETVLVWREVRNEIWEKYGPNSSQQTPL